MDPHELLRCKMCFERDAAHVRGASQRSRLSSRALENKLSAVLEKEGENLKEWRF